MPRQPSRSPSVTLSELDRTARTASVQKTAKLMVFNPVRAASNK